MIRFFEVIKDAPEGIELPARATKFSAGYDLKASKDTVIPSYLKNTFFPWAESWTEPIDLDLVTKTLKSQYSQKKATLIPTGITYHGKERDFLDIRPRSGIASKTMLLIPNSPGTIDADYYPNEIKVAMINLSPYDILIKKGDRIAQAVIREYYTTDNEEGINIERSAGFGSTGEK